MERIRLGSYAVVHFLVDLACALLILGRVCPSWNPATAILLYNLFAFAVQMPAGLLADRFGQCHLFASAGCLLVLAGWLVPPGLTAVITAGLGNALFHIGGGLDTLNFSGQRAGPLGLFVSPGAFGVFLGARWAYSISPWPVCLSLTAAALILTLLGQGQKNTPLALPQRGPRLWGAAACLLLVVIFRSWLGLATDLPWKSDFGMAVICVTVLGKAAGGFLSDRFGMFPTALVSLGVSTVCFLYGETPAAGLTAIFLFQMTMPLTLRAMANLFPGLRGFSFGLLTFGLFLGFLPVYFWNSSLYSTQLALGAFLSLPLLVFGLRQTEKEKF